MRHPVTVERGGFLPPLTLAALFAAFGSRVGIPIAPAAAAGVLAGTGSLVVHELGHLRAARNVEGVRPIGVSLAWLGAGACFEGAYRRGWDQVHVALAGPFASLLAATALLPTLVLPIPAIDKKLSLVAILLNIALAVVNLIPAKPLDGYKALVGMLWSVLGSEAAAGRLIRRATRGWIAAEAVATAVALAERPALGMVMVMLGASLWAQRTLTKPKAASD